MTDRANIMPSGRVKPWTTRPEDIEAAEEVRAELTKVKTAKQKMHCERCERPNGRDDRLLLRGAQISIQGRWWFVRGIICMECLREAIQDTEKACDRS